MAASTRPGRSHRQQVRSFRHQPGIRPSYQQACAIEGRFGIIEGLHVADENQSGSLDRCEFVIGQNARKEDVGSDMRSSISA